MADGSPPAADKDVARPCPVCGGIVPPSLGSKPRKFCSTKCCQDGQRKRKPASVPCRTCGKEVQQAANRTGRTKEYCSPACQRSSHRASRRVPASVGPAKCQVCKKEIQRRGRGRRGKCCSQKCRDEARKKPAVCAVCGRDFLARPGAKTCSPSCARANRAIKASCLRCGKVFTKKRTPAGNYSSSARMYCGRDCAFAHKTERSAWRKLGNWFSKWGDDVWPTLVKCRCGEMHKVSSPSDSQACGRCRHTESRRGPCDKCGQEIIRRSGVRFCRECVAAKKRAARRRQRRRHRQTHGNATTFRKRCRKYSAHYEPVSRKLIFERDKWTCQICRCKLLPKYSLIVGTRQVNPRSPTIDHKIPLSEGPSGPGHTPGNCQAACWGCNTERGNKPLDSFAESKATGLH